MMTITFRLAGPLRQFTDGRSQIEIATEGSSLVQVLGDLWLAHPGLRDRVMTEQGRIRQHVSIFVGNQNSRDTGGLQTPVPDGAEISILAAVSGG